MLDKEKARHSFGRAAALYDETAVLQLEVGQRMLERLDYIRIEPQVILDIGCGTGALTEGLMRRYPRAEVVALDFALPMLLRTRQRGRWLRRPPLRARRRGRCRLRPLGWRFRSRSRAARR